MKKIYEWSQEKNERLIKQRGISFETIVSYIEQGCVVATSSGKGKYSHQKQYIVAVNQYVYIIPYVEKETGVFLKTIIPSRKLTRRYLSGGGI